MNLDHRLTQMNVAVRTGTKNLRVRCFFFFFVFFCFFFFWFDCVFCATIGCASKPSRQK